MNQLKSFTGAFVCLLCSLFAPPAFAEELIPRDTAIKLMNKSAPFEAKRTIYVCDTSALGGGIPKRNVDWHFSKGKDAQLLKHCRGGDVSNFETSHNYSQDTISVLFSPAGLAEMQRQIGPVQVTSSFDGYEHHYIYSASQPLKIAETAKAFAAIEPAGAPFQKLSLKLFRYRVGTIEGVRAPIQFSSEHECSAIVEYRFEVIEPALWAQLFMDTNPAMWNDTISACFVKYDTGWRLKKWDINK